MMTTTTATTTTTRRSSHGHRRLVWEQRDDDDDVSSWRISLRESDDDDDDDEEDSDSGGELVVDAAWEATRLERRRQHAAKVVRRDDPSSSSSLHVVYQDPHVILVNKPGGVLTVPGVRRHDGSLLQAVHEHCVTDENDDDDAPVMRAEHRIVHRLDMDTSGLVLFGRSLDVTKTLQGYFRQRPSQQHRHDDDDEETPRISKRYRAVVAGHWPEDAASGTIDLPLQRDIEHAPFMRVSTRTYDRRARRRLDRLHRRGQKQHWVYQAAKASITRFRVLRRGWWVSDHTFPPPPPDNATTTRLPYTALELEPVTGRTHQLRVHCAAVGYPVLGDPTYGWHGEAAPGGGLVVSANDDDDLASAIAIQRDWWTRAWKPNHAPMCLHAEALRLPHPVHADRVITGHVEAPFASAFAERIHYGTGERTREND